MLAFIEFETYDVAKRLVAKGRDVWLEFKEAFPQVDMYDWEEGLEAPKYAHVSRGPHLIDLMTDGPILAKYDVSFIVKRFKGAYKVAGTAMPPGSTYNLQIAIPAIGLLAMNEVTHLDDACTDELRGYLNDGWRIIAVCPPDAQRRPDYILGRSPEMATKDR